MIRFMTFPMHATMPSSLKNPAYVLMWRGAKVAYVLIGLYVFLLAIRGYWAYGNLVSVLFPIGKEPFVYL